MIQRFEQQQQQKITAFLFHSDMLDNKAGPNVCVILLWNF